VQTSAVEKAGTWMLAGSHPQDKFHILVLLLGVEQQVLALAEQLAKTV
jgi:hypothetical protein